MPSAAHKKKQDTTADASGGTLGWLRTHIVNSIIGAAIIASLTAWFQGAFDSVFHSVVPSGAEAFCALHESIENRWSFAAAPATSDRFTVLIATIDRDDVDRTYTRAVARAFLKRDGVDRIQTCRVLKLADVGRDAEINIVATGRRWLKQRHADLLIGGEVLKKDDALSVWFIDKDPTHDWRAHTFHLNANLLKEDFIEAASTQLFGIALAAIKPATEQNGRSLARILRPVADRLRNLLDTSTGFTARQRADLENALGAALLVIGEQTPHNNALADAADAYNAVLKEYSRDQQPLQWAQTQNNLGTTLRMLGKRENGLVLLEEAIAAHQAALEEFTREQHHSNGRLLKTSLA
jgi:hypothetical protein